MVRIVADTTCGLPRTMLEQRGIPLIPQVVIFGEQPYHDDVELDTAAFLKKLKDSPGLPKTAAPEPALYHPIFTEAAEKGEPVIVVAPTSKASGTVRSAQTAAQDFPGTEIHVVDTMTISCNLGTLVLLAHDLAVAGMPAQGIVDELNRMIPCGQLYFTLDTLEYLARGGRIGRVKAIAGALLNLKPVIRVDGDGKYSTVTTGRTIGKSIQSITEHLVNKYAHTPLWITVLHGRFAEKAEVLANELRSRLNVAKLEVARISPVLGVHTGPGIVGAAVVPMELMEDLIK